MSFINSVHFFNLPIPPSSNSQYLIVRRGRKSYHVPSNELKQFQHIMSQYPYMNDSWLISKQVVRDWLDNKKALEIRCIFKFHYKRLFTLKGEVKKMDVSNRIKALHDCLCKILEIDDSLFFRISAEKQLCHENLGEMACAEIMPYQL